MLILTNRGTSGPTYSEVTFRKLLSLNVPLENRNILDVTFSYGGHSTPGDTVLDVEQTVMLVEYLISALPEKVKERGLPGIEMKTEKYLVGKSLEHFQKAVREYAADGRVLSLRHYILNS